MSALVERIESGRERYSKEGVRQVDLLNRGGRSIEQWKQAVRSMTVGGFRDAAVGVDELEQVLADPHSPLERRIGAALALREVDGGRARIRVAASTAADPRVRIALANAGEDDIDEEQLLRSIAAE